jgi:cytochrome c oxidase subunit II
MNGAVFLRQFACPKGPSFPICFWQPRHHSKEVILNSTNRTHRFKREAAYALAPLAALALFLASCAPVTVPRDVPSTLDIRGPAAANIAELWWIMFGLGTAVFLLVTALLIYIIYSRRARAASMGELDLQDASGARWLLWGGLIMPIAVLAVVFFFNMRSQVALANTPRVAPLTIDVIGQMWWWEVRYPDEDIVTANEIRIPVGRPVQIRLTSLDVIHSFWVPQLHGKQDMTPGRVDVMWLQADEAGIYRGICAEFCGLQHSKMHFLVVAEDDETFQAWLERERQPAPEPTDDFVRRGQQIFLGSACVYCHTVRGTNATGIEGPDLTHIASRLTLGAGILPNNRGNMAGWIIDPQHIKPGNLMPPTALNSEDLQALLAYLDTLE